jgi:hypothetical protein
MGHDDQAGSSEAVSEFRAPRIQSWRSPCCAQIRKARAVRQLVAHTEGGCHAAPSLRCGPGARAGLSDLYPEVVAVAA